MSKRVGPYELLKVERTATSGEIRKAYLVLALKVHPDKNVGDPDAEANFQALQQAYDILKDPVKRKHYDRTGSMEEDMSSAFWRAYEKYKTVEITTKDIEAYLAKYSESEEEEKDILRYVTSTKGNTKNLLAVIVGSKDEDIPRYVALLEKARAEGKIDDALWPEVQATMSKMKTTEELENEVDSIASGDEDDEDDEEEDEEDVNFIVDDEEEDFSDHDDDDDDDDDDSDDDEEDEACKPLFKKDQIVLARWRKGSRYYRGTIVKVMLEEGETPTYSIKYHDDGSTEEGVRQAHIKEDKKKKAQRNQQSTGSLEKRVLQTEERKKERKMNESFQESTEPQEPIEASEEPVSKRPRKARGVSAKKTRSKEENEYDGDLDALRAAMQARSGARDSGFAAFEARWKKKG